MTEQISHKKESRAKRAEEEQSTLKPITVDVSKRQLLKDYYKLDDEETEEEASKEIKEEGNGFNEEEMTLKELLVVHNKLIGKEIEMNNLIKDTIYDNYYDLIKVNNLLKNLNDNENIAVTSFSRLQSLIDEMSK
ncbi:hypothetical protein KAFR_0A03520 [Kazachstania africana CBS 2517]|uniref:Vacuolar protein sorting-associated protein 51 homolog n=1 Tax=Kazachstania africana (strain ATCC 22294 / BCRC 22015 / CBS 2517 / CECT 1963 / NBRC 1671 / NRRL Y-8276) TaxID=1071382 RepID=H2AN37_KAZAF|nr:hypothetical protein KAFR_0A03520 [Kazachstania africana CBS 2517]CCF55787.1 hypothetical protein KAFR_0A03520 [Kazachstania africana CBS 2517]